MFALVARLLEGAVSPLVARLSDFGATLAKKLALFLVAAICFVVVLIALTVAFDLWISTLAGPIAGALAVAAVYLAVGLTAVAVASRTGKSRVSATARTTGAKAPGAKTAGARAGATAAPDHPVHDDRGTRIDEFIAPILAFLQRLGLKREQVAVLAGASVAKQLKPVPLVGLAIVAGFLVGRMWKGWNALMSGDVLTVILSLFAVSRTSMNAPASQDQVV